MGTLRVQVKPANAGKVTVQILMSQYPPTNTPIDVTLTATTSNPIDETYDLDAGLYSVTISWSDGYHNIASGGGEGNNITVNGVAQYYQVLGESAQGQSVLANFGYQV